MSFLNSPPLDRGQKVFAEEWDTRHCKSSKSDTLFILRLFEERTIYETPHKPSNNPQNLSSLPNCQYDKLWISRYSESVGICYHCQSIVKFPPPPKKPEYSDTACPYHSSDRNIEVLDILDRGSSVAVTPITRTALLRSHVFTCSATE